MQRIETGKNRTLINIKGEGYRTQYFTGIELDLSRCLFIFSHNNHDKVNPILKDRMYNIAVEGFNLKQKVKIAEDYLVSQALREVGLFEKVSFHKDIIEHIITNGV